MWQTVFIWGLGAAVVALVAAHLRLRGWIRRLTLALRGPGSHDFRGYLEQGKVPRNVRALAWEAGLHLERRSRQRDREQEFEQTLDSILNNFDDGFLEVAEDLTIRYANLAVQERFAQERNVVGRQVMEAFRDHRIDQIIRQALEQDEKVSDTVHLESHTAQRGETVGKVLSVEAVAVTSPLRSQRGVWVILRDESQRHYLEQERKNFVANASHEFRTPLSIICGYLESLVQGTVADPESVRRFCGVMLKHANRLGRIVEQMLAVSKLESGPECLRRKPFDLADSIRDMVEHLQPLIHEREAKILLRIPEGDRRIEGERTVWDQVFFNLIENSLRQNEAPGLEVEVRMRSDETRHFLEVVDNGVGIPATHINEVFRRFFCIDRHHSRNRISGTGLGLFIVKRAVEAHGGTIGVSSVPGVETRFTICVPRHYVEPDERSGA